MAKTILIKSVVSEKAELLSESKQQYTFVVNGSANKIEVRNAVESRYGVTVDSVNTMNMPGKSKKQIDQIGRSPRSGIRFQESRNHPDRRRYPRFV